MPIRPENKAKYPANWKAISAHRRLFWAGNRCEWCGAIQHHPHPKTGSKVVLTTAHLNHIEEDCRDENLRSLCQKCHNTYDAPNRRKGIRQRSAANQRELFTCPLPQNFKTKGA